MMIRCFFSWMVVLVAVPLWVGCASNQIQGDRLYGDDPNFGIDSQAQIEDTTDAREILDILSQYREALVNKDFGTLTRLVSEDYYDNAGTTGTTSDDYTYRDLEQVFERMAQHANEVRYAINVKDLQVHGSRAHIDYEFNFAYRYQVEGVDTWDAGSDVNRLVLAREGERWRITSGM